ncbi:MAG: PKD domain-containing protein [Bacteroidota bacterium]
MDNSKNTNKRHCEGGTAEVISFLIRDCFPFASIRVSMTRPINILCLFALLLISSCKKEYPPTSSNGNPVFYFNGTINGNPVNIQAGINNYYMYSSFNQDSTGLYVFSGDLKQSNYTSNNKIQFQINDFQTSAINAPIVIDSLLSDYYPIQVPPPDIKQIVYTVNFTSIPNDSSALTYSWNFGDGTTSSSANPSHVYSRPGIYHVFLLITYSGSCVSSIDAEVKVGIPSADCRATIINSTDSNTNAISFSALATGTPPFTYFWKFGDGTTATLQNITHIYSISGLRKVHLKVKDANNYIANTYKYVSTQNYSGCMTNLDFEVNVDSIYIPNPSPPPPFHNVTITWTDNAGVVYDSNNSFQPNDSYFQIVSVEDYLKNQNNQPTKKLHVKFKCQVFNGSNSLQIDNGDAVIAVSYK